MNDVSVRSKRIVTSEGELDGVLTMRGSKITTVQAVAEAPAPQRTDVLVPDDCVLIPGLVDSHVHINEPGRTEWEGFASATAAAAAGGVTTVVDMPLNSIPPTVDVEALRIKQAAALDRISVDVAFWGGAVPGNLDRLRPMHEAGVVGFKCFLLPSGVDEFGYLDQPALFAAMAEIASFGGLLIAHAEDPAVIESAPPPTGRSYANFLASRPPQAEHAAIGLLLEGIRRTGCRSHIVHLSSAGALDPIAAAKDEGLPLSVETCPHYLTLSADLVPDGATQFKCCPPIRDAGNADALWGALADGLIDCVVSDHSPATAKLKHLDTGDFGAAWGGIASLQLGLPVMWTAAAQRGHTWSELVRWMARGPAELIGLAGDDRVGGDKGRLAAGYDADFCIVAPDETLVVDPRTLLHRNPITPYAGAMLRGVVRETWLRGNRIDPARPDGRLLARSVLRT
ncbi:MAG: allantoinase [Pseudonocardiales bacterium]|nr:allantoinase [Pseudonocardiales bacterium]